MNALRAHRLATGRPADGLPVFAREDGQTYKRHGAPRYGLDRVRAAAGRALLDRLMEIAGIDLESLADRIAADPSLGSRVAAGFVERLDKTDIDQLLVTPAMEKALHSIQETFATTLQDAFTPQLASTFAAAAGLEKNSVIEEVARKLSKQLVSSEVMKEFSRSWTKSLADSLTISPETLTLARSAQQAASNG